MLPLTFAKSGSKYTVIFPLLIYVHFLLLAIYKLPEPDIVFGPTAIMFTNKITFPDFVSSFFVALF